MTATTAAFRAARREKATFAKFHQIERQTNFVSETI
jgi:hypothetical protein